MRDRYDLIKKDTKFSRVTESILLQRRDRT